MKLGLDLLVKGQVASVYIITVIKH